MFRRKRRPPPPPPSSGVAIPYFEALARRDLDGAVASWLPGGIERIGGQRELVAPDGIRAYFGALFGAFPDMTFEVAETTEEGERCVVRWRARGTFAGPGGFQGFTPNGARIEIEGCDVVTVADGRITHNDVYLDSGEIARQLGVLPSAGSTAEARLTRIANARTRFQHAMHGAEPEAIAAGVWVVRGGRPRTMNVYLLEDEGGVTVFDAGIADMTPAVAAAGARLGGIRRVILGHADCDHRGAAARLGAPVYCHPLERAAAESSASQREYWDLDRLAFWARPAWQRLVGVWDGGALDIAGTVEEGEEIAGFQVVHLPGHAPGLIGLYRERDGLALVSDCFYTIDPQTGIHNSPHVPHPAFNCDTDQARDSIRKLAELRPAAAWAGHANPVTGEDVSEQLSQAASTTP